ncbi:MAG: BatA domain-containing protein [Pirellulaceae bacterium]
MSPTFAFPALIVGMALVVAPLLIHLINMLRHRRVKWAAMDFLLQSHKRNRNWVWLKQLLLLLMRMAAVALLVLMLAGFGCDSKVTQFLSGQETHHIVLLDDSYSTGDLTLGESAFDRANKAIQSIAREAAKKDNQKFTLLRYSQVAGREDVKSLAEAADINGETVDRQFGVLLEEIRRGYDVTQLAVGPNDAVDVAGQLMQDDDRNVVYVVSDFRAKEWQNPTDIRQSLEELHDRGAEIQLISCMPEEHPNLAILDVSPADKTRAAGVPLPVDVKVKNFSRQPARNVQVKVRSLFYDPTVEAQAGADAAAAAEQMQPDIDELPVVVIEEIAPGETVERRVQVYFPLGGRHVIEAWVEDEHQKIDDRRFAVVDFPEGVPVLVIDGTGLDQHAYYMRTAFDPAVRDDEEDAPRIRANTGVRPELQNEAFLRDATPEELAKYHAIYLLDVGRLDDRAVTNLEKYVAAGGGLGVFMGENVDTSFYNGRFYNEGEGLLPAPLTGFAGLPPAVLDAAADIEIGDSPVFAEFTGERYLMMRMVMIERYLQVREDWEPNPTEGVRVAAKLRNGDPLTVERSYGDGRVVAMLTSVAPIGSDGDGTPWNNWTRTPAFPMIALEMQSYLGKGRRHSDDRAVGAPIDVQLEVEDYQPELTFMTPGVNDDERISIEKVAQRVAEDSPLMEAAIGEDTSARRGDETDRRGVYEAWAVTTQGSFDVRRFAVNVDPLEGEMAIVPELLLKQKLESVKPKVSSWKVIEETTSTREKGPWAQIFLAILVVLLLGEQLLAYAVSYHPLRGAAA